VGAVEEKREQTVLMEVVEDVEKQLAFRVVVNKVTPLVALVVSIKLLLEIAAANIEEDVTLISGG